MRGHSSGVLRPLLGGPVFAILALALASCGEEPTPPRLISFSPATLTVPADGTLALSVEYEENDFALPDFQWTVAAGAIEGNGAPSITYRPPAEPGEYRVAVTAPYGDGDARLSLDSVITVTAAAAASPPSTPAPAAGQAATPTAAAPAAPATAEATAASEEAAGQTAPRSDATGAASAPAGQAVGQTAPTAPPPAQPATAADQEAAAAGREVAALAEKAEGEGAQAGREQGAPAAPTGAQPTVAALTTAAGPAGGSRLDQILDRHRLTAVVQIALKPFSFYGEDGRRTGFEIDFLREFARRWLDDPTAVTFLPVPIDARISTLQKGRADLIGAALTKTPARAEQVDFSLTYFKDGQQLLVPEASAVADVCDLKGKKVAAIEGSTGLDNIKAAAGKCGFELGADLITFRRHGDAIEALLDGQVEAYTNDGVALASAAEGQPLKVVGNHFSEEPYGFAVPKGDERLLQLIDHTLEEMERDGTYAAIYAKWFGDSIRPYPLEESETVAATEVAALATTSAPPLVEPKSAPAAPVDSYVVRAGDTLSRIAGKVYGDVSPKSWERIWQANRDLIGDNPSRIQVGMTLTIPQ